MNSEVKITELKKRQEVMKSDTTWKGISNELRKRAINPSEVIIATYFSEDVEQEYWAIVTYDKKVYEFYYDWSHRDAERGKIIEWNDFTEHIEKIYMKEEVQEVLENFEALINT